MRYSYLILILTVLVSLGVDQQLTAQGGFPGSEQGLTTDTPVLDDPTATAGSGVVLNVPPNYAPLGGLPMKENDFARDELVFWFDQALDNAGKSQFKNMLTSTLGYLPPVTFSRWSHYALVEIKAFKDVCEFIGEGNPLTGQMGEGQEVGLNYTLSNRAWGDAGQICVGLTGTVQGISSGTASQNRTQKTDHGPISNCTSSSSIIPATGRKQTRIAIIDSGVSGSSLDDLYGLHLSADKIDPEGNFLEAGAPSHPHGTFIANIIGALANEADLTSRIALHSYEVLNKNLRTSIFAVVSAIEDATYNEELRKGNTMVISLSIGFIPVRCKGAAADDEGDSDDFRAPSSDWDVLDNAIAQARDAGVIVVTSAGNRGVNLAERPQYPAAYTGLDNLITVGALRCDSDKPVFFSNYSREHVDLFTTGAHVRSFAGGCYKDVHGTSFSTPIVAAKAAMHISAQSTYNLEEVVCRLKDQSKNFSRAQPWDLANFGIVDVTESRGLCGSIPSGSFSGRNSFDVAADVSVAPNPFNNSLAVSLPPAADGTASMLSVYDSNGKVLLRRESKQAKEVLDLSELQPGVYWLNVRSAGSTTTKPIVKN